MCFFHSVYPKPSTDVKLLATDVVNPNLLFEATTTAPELEGILSKITFKQGTWCGQLTSPYFAYLYKRGLYSTCPFV